MITKRQFETEITNIMQRAANLTSSEIKQLSEYYETLDGRCNYKQFVETIENAFNIPNLEKKPTAYVIRPATGLLSKVGYYLHVWVYNDFNCIRIEFKW